MGRAHRRDWSTTVSSSFVCDLFVGRIVAAV